MENGNHKKRVMELEVEVKKLSGQQNIQQRIHHHAKIKARNCYKTLNPLTSTISLCTTRFSWNLGISSNLFSQEENNSLRCQNEDLSIKLHKTEAILSRVKEELAQFRLANGRNPYINFDEEQQLNKKLKVSVKEVNLFPHEAILVSNRHVYLKQETEEERLQLAQKLLGLCTTVLRVSMLHSLSDI